MPVFPNAVERNLAEKLGERISILDFGAVAGGLSVSAAAKTANRVAIQNAIEAVEQRSGAGGVGGRIYIPGRDDFYCFDADPATGNGLLIRGSNITLEGDGHLASRLFFDSADGVAINCDALRDVPREFTADAGTDTLTLTASPMPVYDGLRVMVTSTGTLPAPLAEETWYVVATTSPLGLSFQLRETEAGAVINLSDAGTGTHSLLYSGCSQLCLDNFHINSFDLAGFTRTDGANIRIRNYGDYRVRNVWMRNGWHGLEIRSSYSGKIQNCLADNYAPGEVPQVAGGGLDIGFLVTENSIVTDISHCTAVIRGYEGGVPLAMTAGLMIDKGIDTCRVDDFLSERHNAGILITNNGDNVNNPNYDHDPRWVKISRPILEPNDTNGYGLQLLVGTDVTLTDPYIKGGKSGIHLTTGADGFKLLGGLIFGSQQWGILLDEGNNIEITGTHITYCSQTTPSTSPLVRYSCIGVGASVTDFHIRHGRFGNFMTHAGMSGFGTYSAYGVYIAGPSDDYSVEDCDCRGNVTGTIYDGTPALNASANGLVWEQAAGCLVFQHTQKVGVRDSAGSVIPVLKMNTDNTLLLGVLSAPASNGHLILHAGGAEKARLSPSGVFSMGSVFQVDANGNLGIIKSLAYSWPSAHGSGILSNDGSGTLSWTLPDPFNFTGDLVMENTKAIKWKDSGSPVVTGKILSVGADNVVVLGWQSAPASNGHLLLYANGGEKVRIAPNGNVFVLNNLKVGYSTDFTDPTSTLQVGGATDVSSLKISGTEVISSSAALHNCTADAGIITSGQFNAARIPNLAGSIITSGTVDAARLGASPSSSKFLKGDNSWAFIDAGDVPDISATYLTVAGGFTGTVSPVNSITVASGKVTACS